MIRRLKPLLRHLRRAHTLSRWPPRTPKPPYRKPRPQPQPQPQPQPPKPIPTADVYTISGVPVEFPLPHKPYDTQLVFMAEVISTLDRARRQGHCHALLESPTGTGKSLSLLCAALAWQRRFGEEAAAAAAADADADAEKKGRRKNVAPKIYFASRTHSQLTQVIAEYEKTSYRVPMAVLASKKQYCVNKKVCKKGNVDEECKLLLRDKSCRQFINAKKVRVHPSILNEVHNVKDLVEVGRTVRGCPFFAARLMADEAQLVFCPYDYIINTNIRGAMDIDIKGAIIILDEAHNIEEVAREAGSLDVEEGVLCNLQMELDQLRKCEGIATIYQPLYNMIKGILSWMADRARDLQEHDLETLNWTGHEAMKELQQAGITQCFPQLQECASKAIRSKTVLSGTSATTLEKIVSSLGYLFTQNGSPAINYQLVLKRDHSNTSSGWKNSLGLWCLNPAIVFKEITDLCLSVILTSGTLSPMSSFASELGVQFEACLEAPHVVDVKSQLWAAVISSGPGNCKLNASFETAYGSDFQDALGDSLEKIFKVVPGGVLVFFPSYKLMDRLLVRWSQTGQRSLLNAQKSIFIEPKKGLDALLEGYRDSIPRGAVLLAVCRGKVSEGIDFSDENARAVVIVGIPYPDISDRKVVLKRKYNDMYKSSKGLLNGGEWYCQQAFRAVNQAVGRCIRHRFDYGAIILLDERFKEQRNVAYTSKWLRDSIKQYDNFDKSIEDLTTFFEEHRSESLRWSPPAEGALKLNFSGVVDSRTGNAVAGFIVGNHKREVLICGGVKVAGNSVLLAEGCALRVALKVLQDEGYTGQLYVESDNKTLISNLKQVKPVNDIIKSCCRMLQSRGDWQASHTCQEANSATVWLAQEAKRSGDFVWSGNFPPELVELLA